MRAAWLAVLGIGLGLPALAAATAGNIPVRVGDHTGFGRIVFDLPGRTTYHLSRDGDRVTLRFDDAGQVMDAPHSPHNVREITGGESRAEITLAPGARLRTMRLGTRLVIDVLDPEPARAAPKSPGVKSKARAERQDVEASPPAKTVKPAAQALSQEAAGAERKAQDAPALQIKADAHTEPVAPPEMPQQADAASEAEAKRLPDQPPTSEPATASVGTQPATISAPAQPVTAAPLPAAEPLASMARRVASPPGMGGSAILLPFGREVGAASFPHGGEALVVFDTRRPIDLSSLRGDPAFGTASIQMLPDATVLRLKLPAGQKLRLDHAADGWMVILSATEPGLAPIEPAQDGPALALPVNEPGHVVVVPDPQTGENLLVGTQRRAGQGVPVRRRAPFFALGQTWLGVLVEPLSDRLELRALPGRFVLLGQGLNLDLTDKVAAAAAGAGALTRRFDFPDLPEAALRRRMQLQVDAAALAPPLSRFAPRFALAETMVALGMGAEAEAVLHLAMADDPQHVADPDATGLAAIAAMLAGRDADFAGLEDQRLSGTDEIALWRAIRAARHADAAQAAPVFAATLPLLLSYPAALRRRLLPLAAETMVEGGALQAASELLARRAADSGLAFARAMLLQKKGDMKGALHAFDALATSPDRLLRARAARRAVEIRLAAGQLDARGAANALEKLLLAWRGDGRERDLRLRIAALRAQAGEWRASLDLLRETEKLFPDQRKDIHIARAETFAAMLKDRQHVAPLDLVTMAEENADVAPAGPAGDALAATLADRLMQLDLPRHAEALLDRLARGAPPGPVRAVYGARLAQLRLEDGDAAGALGALADTNDPDLSPELKQQRGLLVAHALLRRQQPAQALAVLAGMDTASADDLRATILSDTKDWPGAVSALKELAAKSVLPNGGLTEDQQRILLRLASAAAEAGDESVLRELRERETPRMRNPQLAGMFRLLTSGGVHRLSELPRVASEIAMARALPADLRAVSAPQPARDPVMQ